MFRFLYYSFDDETFTASFHYEGPDKTPFTERVKFVKTDRPIHYELLDRALFLSFILIGTSYYKAHPTKNVSLDAPLDDFQADFFSRVYQEGLSQYAFENNLTRADLVNFEPSQSAPNATAIPINHADFFGILSLQSGGKDSLLTASLIKNATFWHLGSSNHYPKVLNSLNGPLQIAVRTLDLSALEKTKGLNGHVPITYIVESLALIQAILNHNNTVLTSIGQEGNEPHAFIDDLPVNHQWSKSWPAEKAFAKYVKTYISPDLNIGSPLRGFSELKIAELFVKNCWKKYGHEFSSCNVANYRQKTENNTLKWCGRCAKCANSYLLFAPFLEPEELNSLFDGKSLFEEPSLFDDFKGLLGVDNQMKPFECVGEVAELRRAYHMKSELYPNLPFAVPDSNFDYQKISETQKGLIYAK